LNDLLHAQRYAEAQTGALAMLGQIERTRGDESLEAALVIDVLVESQRWIAKSDPHEQRALAERSLRIKEKVLGPDHLEVAKRLTILASVHRESSDWAGARPLFERALTIREESLGPDHPDVAASLNSLAILLRTTG